MKSFLVAVMSLLVGVSTVYSQADSVVDSQNEPAPNKWPRVFGVPNATITIYQPQIETFKDNVLTARAAVSVAKKGDANPVYSAVWMKARLRTDKDSRIVTMRDLKVTKISIPNTSDKAKKVLGDLISKQLMKGNLKISLDRLLAMMDVIDKRKKNSAKLEDKAPQFFFSKEPAVLVYIDGEPVMRDLENGLSQIANSRFLILLDSADKKYYLKCAGRWFSAAEIKGPWAPENKVPKKVAKVGDKEDPTEADPTGDVPKVFVAFQPAELIQSYGEPELAQIPGTNLSYLKNSDNDIFRDENNQKLYLLVSGRWFTADVKEGPWTYISSDKLPADFKKIPANSPKANVLASITGTQEAKDAVMESYIPQTATIKRGETSLDITYDGEPEFKPIEGTSMSYAVNTETPVVKLNAKYYACDNGAWYEGATPKGQWAVCANVPEEIYSIPPSCPIYNSTFVKVYGSDDDSVDVGYTSGYDDSYDDGGTVVYGTGFCYPRWWRRHWCPRPVTYGGRYRYDRMAARWNRYDRYRDRLGRYVAWNRRNIKTPRNMPARAQGYYKGAAIAAVARNAYKYNKGTIRTAYKARNIRSASAKTRSVTTRRNRANNVYVGKNGKIYKHGLDGWQQRNKGKWSSRNPVARPANKTAKKFRPTKPAARPAKRQASRQKISAAKRRNLQKSYRARQRGNTRVKRHRNYSRSRSRSRSSRSSRSRGARRSGGARRGGGGRRR